MIRSKIVIYYQRCFSSWSSEIISIIIFGYVSYYTGKIVFVCLTAVVKKSKNTYAYYLGLTKWLTGVTKLQFKL